MASYRTSPTPSQLSLDLDLGDIAPRNGSDAGGVERSVIFPKNIQIFNVAEFQQRVSLLFDPLHISIEFRLTRQNRLEMRWSFPDEAIQYNNADAPQYDNSSQRNLSAEENKAFETLVLSFAGAAH